MVKKELEVGDVVYVYEDWLLYFDKFSTDNIKKFVVVRIDDWNSEIRCAGADIDIFFTDYVYNESFLCIDDNGKFRIFSRDKETLCHETKNGIIKALTNKIDSLKNKVMALNGEISHMKDKIDELKN